MFSSKIKNNGYILIATLTIVTVLMTIMLYIFNLNCGKRVCLNNYKTYIINDKIDYKKYMFSKLNKFIKSKVLELNKEEIRNVFLKNKDFNIKYEDHTLIYSKINDCFIIVYKYNNDFYEIDFYEYFLDEDKNIKFKFNKGKLTRSVVKNGF